MDFSNTLTMNVLIHQLQNCLTCTKTWTFKVSETCSCHFKLHYICQIAFSVILFGASRSCKVLLSFWSDDSEPIDSNPTCFMMNSGAVKPTVSEQRTMLTALTLTLTVAARKGCFSNRKNSPYFLRSKNQNCSLVLDTFSTLRIILYLTIYITALSFYFGNCQ